VVRPVFDLFRFGFSATTDAPKFIHPLPVVLARAKSIRPSLCSLDLDLDRIVAIPLDNSHPIALLLTA
jgi:hypothetical protein